MREDETRAAADCQRAMDCRRVRKRGGSWASTEDCAVLGAGEGEGEVPEVVEAGVEDAEAEEVDECDAADDGE